MEDERLRVFQALDAVGTTSQTQECSGFATLGFPWTTYGSYCHETHNRLLTEWVRTAAHDPTFFAHLIAYATTRDVLIDLSPFPVSPPVAALYKAYLGTLTVLQKARVLHNLCTLRDVLDVNRLDWVLTLAPTAPFLDMHQLLLRAARVMPLDLFCAHLHGTPLSPFHAGLQDQASANQWFENALVNPDHRVFDFLFDTRLHKFRLMFVSSFLPTSASNACAVTRIMREPFYRRSPYFLAAGLEHLLGYPDDRVEHFLLQLIVRKALPLRYLRTRTQVPSSPTSLRLARIVAMYDELVRTVGFLLSKDPAYLVLQYAL